MFHNKKQIINFITTCLLFTFISNINLTGAFAGTIDRIKTIAELESKIQEMQSNILNSNKGNADKTIEWLKKYNEIVLEYHCRTRFGLNKKKWNIDTKQVGLKWQEIDLDSSNVDPALLNYLSATRAFELFMVSQTRRSGNEWFKYIIGKGVQNYLEIEDDSPLAPSADDALEETAVTVFSPVRYRPLLRKMHQSMTARIKSHYPDKSKQILELWHQTKDPDFLAEYEMKWLEENYPVAYKRFIILSERDLSENKKALATVMTPEFEATIHKYHKPYGYSSKYIFMKNEMKQYEEDKLPHHAVVSARWLNKYAINAIRESMRIKADSLNSPEQAKEKMKALQLSTLFLWSDRYNKYKRLVVRPYNTYVKPIVKGRGIKKARKPAKPVDVLIELAELGKEEYGYLGTLNAIEAPKQIRISSNGKRLLAMGQTGIETFDLENGKQVSHAFGAGEENKLKYCAITSDGKYAYVVDSSPAIRRYILDEGKQDNSFTPIPVIREDAIIALSENGKYLAIASYKGTILFNLKSNKATRKIEHTYNIVVHGIRFTPNGKTLYHWGNSPFFDISSTSKGKMQMKTKFTERGNYYVSSVKKTSSGFLLAAGRGGATVWKGNSKSPVLRIEEEYDFRFRMIQMTSNNSHVVTDKGVWNLKTGKSLFRYEFGTQIQDISPDGKRIAVAFGTNIHVIPVIIDDINETGTQEKSSDKKNEHPGLSDKDIRKANGKINIAKNLYRSGLTDKAIKYLKKVIKDYPDSKPAEKAKELLKEY